MLTILTSVQRLFRNHLNIPGHQIVQFTLAIISRVTQFHDSTLNLKHRGAGRKRTQEDIEKVRVTMTRNPKRSAMKYASPMNITDANFT